MSQGAAPAEPRARRWRTRLVVLALSTLVIGVVAEVVLRSMLFGSSTSATSRRLRQAEWYTPGFDQDYWKLQAIFTRGEGVAPRGFDPRIGWTGDVEPATGAHPDEVGLGGREPVLLFGDSYAECVTPPEECWQGLFARSEFGADRRMLNYGVGGYGLDQMALLLERVVPRFAADAAAAKPTVLVGIFVDDDLERCDLSIRGWLKPRFVLRDGVLVLEEPGHASIAEWSEQHPPRIVSYLVRLLRRAILGARAFDESWTDASTLDERRAVCRAILERIVTALDEMGVARRAFVLFDGRASLADSPRAVWQRELVERFGRERGEIVVSTTPYLRAATEGDADPLARLLTPDSTFQRGHYDATGNRVAFEAILQALRVCIGGGEDRASVGVERVRAWRAAGELETQPTLALRFALLDRPLYSRVPRDQPVLRLSEPVGGPARLSLRPSAHAPTEVEIELRGARRLSANVRALAPPKSDPGSTPLEMIVSSSTGGEARLWVEPGAEAVRFEQAVSGERVRIRVDRAGGARDGIWLVLDAIALDDS